MNREININDITCKLWLSHSERHNQATRIQLTTFNTTCSAKLMLLLRQIEIQLGTVQVNSIEHEEQLSTVIHLSLY